MAINYSNLRKKLRMVGRFRKMQRTGRFPYKMKPARKPYYKYSTKARKYIKAYKGYKRNSAYGGYYARRDKERVMLPWKNFQNGTGADYLGQLPALASPYAGNVTGQVSLKVLQTGENLTSQNDILNTDIAGSVTTLNGFTASSGVANFNGLGEIVGKAAVLTSSFIRFTITMDSQALEYPPEPDGDVKKVFAYAMPHDFRILIVRAKRQNSVDTSVALSTNSELNEPALRTNLFRDENGDSKGLADDTSVADLFNWSVNSSKWEKCHEMRCTLKAMVLPYTPGNTGAGVYTRLNLDGTPKYPSQITYKKYLPVPKKKVDFGFQDSTASPPSGQPINFNYVYHTVILARVQGSTSQVTSNTWNVQANGATAMLD
jgi:hypothetical protein